MLKILVLTHYSNGEPKCSCCGVLGYEFLTIEHPNGMDDRRRLEHGHDGGWRLYRKIIKQGYPEGLRVFCFNCNIAKGRLGECPHRAIQQELELPLLVCHGQGEYWVGEGGRTI
jgi:hypothetical protein